MILHTSLQELRQNINQRLNPQKTPIPRPDGRAMGCLSWIFCRKLTSALYLQFCVQIDFVSLRRTAPSTTSRAAMACRGYSSSMISHHSKSTYERSTNPTGSSWYDSAGSSGGYLLPQVRQWQLQYYSLTHSVTRTSLESLDSSHCTRSILYQLTHWSLGDAEVILQVNFSSLRINI